MRTKFFSAVAALLLCSTGAAAQGQATTSDDQRDVAKVAAAPSNAEVGLVNQIDFGVRGTVFGENSDQARFMRYRDLRDGGTLDRIRILKETNTYRATVQGDHVGYRDQRFFGSVDNYGKLKASFEWNQTPLFYSNETRTLYATSSAGQLTLPDAVQSGIQNKTLTLPNALTGAATFDLRTRRDVATANLIYSATPSVDMAVVARSTQKTGAYPWGGSFGISNAIATEMPVPVDHRTTDLTTSVEYANQRAYARLAYDGSFFRNDVTTLVWDNPARITDSPTAGPAQGRIALWPNTNMNTVSAAAGLNMAGHSRASGYVSIASLSNNDPLLPYTINSALVSPALARPTADVTARAITMNYQITSRPTRMLWLSARYRQQEFDNRTVPFEIGNSVNYDTAVVALNKESEPFGQTRHTFDADVSVSPMRVLGFKAGYTREEVDRTFRIVENTTEDIGRVSMDVTGIGWLTVRGVFEHGKRRGSPVNGLELLAIGEQPTLRQYDISDRDQDRFSTIITVTPVSQFSVNGSVSFGRQEYPGTNFGLRNNDNHVYTIGVDFVPADHISMGVSYGFERYTALQASRTANPLPANTVAFLNDPTQQFNDPRRDWTDDSADRVHTVDASVDLLKVIPKTDIRFSYDYSRAESTYVYGLAPNTTIAAPVQLTPVLNGLHQGLADLRYYVTRHVAVGGVYMYERYRVDDFALGPVASLSQPANAAAPTLMMLGYFYRPYTANSLMARLTYLW
jgi:MtrB/PioB family decaheme-associated outer membrane protein